MTGDETADRKKLVRGSLFKRHENLTVLVIFVGFVVIMAGQDDGREAGPYARLAGVGVADAIRPVFREGLQARAGWKGRARQWLK